MTDLKSAAITAFDFKSQQLEDEHNPQHSIDW